MVGFYLTFLIYKYIVLLARLDDSLSENLPIYVCLAEKKNVFQKAKEMFEGFNFFHSKGTERRIYHFKSKEFIVCKYNIQYSMFSILYLNSLDFVS